MLQNFGRNRSRELECRVTSQVANVVRDCAVDVNFVDLAKDWTKKTTPVNS